jgi:hypothetical protein
MKTGIMVLLALGATVVWGTDLNPVGANACGAGAIWDDPSTYEGEEAFNLLYDNLNDKIGDGEMWKINTDDTTWWDSSYYPQPFKTWRYLMVKFVKPAGYNTGKLNWCVKVEGGADIYAYRWNKSPTPHQWTYMNKNAGGSDPSTAAYSIPASYFDGNGVRWLLFKGGGNPETLSTDVVDIHW